MDIFAVSRIRHNRRHEFLIKCGSRLPGNTDNAVAVHAVGCDFILKYHVAQSQNLHRIRTHFTIVREDIDA